MCNLYKNVYIIRFFGIFQVEGTENEIGGTAGWLTYKSMS